MQGRTTSRLDYALRCPSAEAPEGVEFDLEIAPVMEGDGLDNLDLDVEAVSDFPHSKYTAKEIAKAGKALAGDLETLGAEVPQHILKAFQVANNWRNAHAYPMRSIHASLRYYVKANDLDAITAARLKRMQAIRAKLRRIGVKFHRLQDLGGCRVIVATTAETRLLVEVLKSKLPSVVQKEDDYISKPKNDGYRSHHLIFGFRRSQPTPFDDKRIEVQIRTHLQHAWATTVEAVGLLRGEGLKNQKGDKDWLRFFALMSAEFAEAEKCPTVPGTPDSRSRKAEIRTLAAALDIVKTLDAVAIGFRGTDLLLAPGYKPTHYLIRFDHSTKTVRVESYNKPQKATVSYDKAEEILRSGDQNDVVVLVEADKINNLKRAYPNYFGDVEVFQRQLKHIVGGGAALEYTRPPKERTKRVSAARGDLSWLRGTRFPGPRDKKKKRKR